MDTKRHWENKLIAPGTWDCPLFDIPIEPYTGRAFVIMCPIPEETGEGFEWHGEKMKLLLPRGVYEPDKHDSQGDIAAKYHAPDFGRMVKFKARRDSDGRYLKPIDRELDRIVEFFPLVAVKPYKGTWLNSRDFDWIPEGRMVKILGSPDDIGQDIVAVVQFGKSEAA